MCERAIKLRSVMVVILSSQDRVASKNFCSCTGHGKEREKDEKGQNKSWLNCLGISFKLKGRARTGLTLRKSFLKKVFTT